MDQGQRAAERRELPEMDWDEDVQGRRCRNCRRIFYIRRGQQVRHCPLCGAALVRRDLRRAQPLGALRAREL